MFDQLEKVLMRSAFDPAFAEEVRSAGDSAVTRYAMGDQEGRLLGMMLENDGAGLTAILNVISSSRATALAMATAGIPQAPAGGTA